MMKKPPITGRSRQLPWKDTFAYALPALSLAVIGIPVYVFLPKFYTDTMGMGISTVGALLMAVRVFFLGPGDAGMYGVLVFLSGIGFGAGLALPSAIQADVIDYDQLLTGQRREGRYIGLWSIAKKLSAALGIGIGLLLLGTTGYSPNVEQAPSTVFMLRILYALVPCLCNVVSIAIISFYPISEEKHFQIRSKLTRMEQQSS
jgi:Na+/melibiose symporter-like transporter